MCMDNALQLEADGGLGRGGGRAFQSREKRVTVLQLLEMVALDCIKYCTAVMHFQDMPLFLLSAALAAASVFCNSMCGTVGHVTEGEVSEHDDLSQELFLGRCAVRLQLLQLFLAPVHQGGYLLRK